MEKQKKREWVMKAIIVFLVIMLILTFFSNTIMNYSLPEVTAQYCYSGEITNRIRGNGVVEADDPYSVKTGESRKVESLGVEVGSVVSQGDVLYYLEEGESEELKEARIALDKLIREYEKSIVTGAVDKDITQSVDSGNTGSLESKQNRVLNAKALVESWEKKVKELEKQDNVFNDGPASHVAEKKALEEAKKALEEWTEQNLIDTDALTTAETEYNTAQSDVEACEAALKEAKKKDVSGSDNSAEIKKCEKALKEAKKVRDEKKKLYNGAKANLDNSTYMVKCCTADVNAKQEALDEKGYSISTQLSDAKDSLQKAKDAYEELIEEMSTMYGLEDKKTAIKAQEKVVEELEGKDSLNAIVAPVGGTVISLKYGSGDTLEKDTEVATIQKASNGLRINMSIKNEQARYVNVGDEATVENSWWYSDVHARVIKIGADKDNPTTNRIITFEVEGDLTAGQSLSLSVGNKSAYYDNVVPSSAVREDNKGYFVYRVVSKNTPFGNRYVAERVDVTILAEDDKETAVSGDLSDWEYIITNASKPVEDGKQVRLKD